MTEKSPLSEASTWARQEIARRIAADGSVQIPDVANVMVAHYRNDAEWLSRFLGETFRQVAYDVAQRQCASTRGGVVFGDAMMPREEFTKEIKRRRARWEVWLEQVGDRQVRLFDMGATDLMTAAAERRRRGSIELQLAVLWETLADRCGRRKKVREVWTAQEITNLAASLDIQIETVVSVIGEEAREAA